MPPNVSDEQQWAAHLWATQCIQQITATFLVIITMIITLLNTNDPEPYHTSILSGCGWVDELLEGHPGHICCKLGVSREVFLELVSVLCSFGYGSSRYVDIEEQLAIFLYMSVTGLTIWHTGKQFQWSNNTISKYFHCMLKIFSIEPFYTTYINLITWQCQLCEHLPYASHPCHLSMWILLPLPPLLPAPTQPQPPSYSLHLLCFHATEWLPVLTSLFREVLERFWITNEDIHMLREGTCDSELGSYPGQVRECPGSYQ